MRREKMEYVSLERITKMIKRRYYVALLFVQASQNLHAVDEGWQHMSDKQISALTRDQVTSISDANLVRLSANWITHLVNPSRSEHEPRCNGQVSVREWQQNHARQTSRMTDYQIVNLNRDKFGELCAYDFENISPETMTKIDVTEIHSHEIPALLNPKTIINTNITTYTFTLPRQTHILTENQIKSLRPQQLSELRYDDLHNISNECIRELTVEQINALSPNSIAYLINPARFAIENEANNADGENRTPLLSRDQFNNLRPEQLADLTVKDYDFLQDDYLALLNNDKKRVLFPKCLSPEKFSALPDEELRRLTDEQLRQLTLRQMSQLTQNKLQLFRLAQLPERNADYAVNIRNIPPIRIRAMTNDELNQLLFG